MTAPKGIGRRFRRARYAVTRWSPSNRWAWANLLNRLPWTCWAQLVSWALGGARLRDVGQGGPDGTCGMDMRRNGACYCAKLATPEFRARHLERRGDGA